MHFWRKIGFLHLGVTVCRNGADSCSYLQKGFDLPLTKRAMGTVIFSKKFA